MRFAVATILLAASASVSAQTPANLMKCVAIARDADRLACFDSAMIDTSPEARAAAKVRAAEILKRRGQLLRGGVRVGAGAGCSCCTLSTSIFHGPVRDASGTLAMRSLRGARTVIRYTKRSRDTASE